MKRKAKRKRPRACTTYPRHCAWLRGKRKTGCAQCAVIKLWRLLARRTGAEANGALIADAADGLAPSHRLLLWIHEHLSDDDQKRLYAYVRLLQGSRTIPRKPGYSGIAGAGREDRPRQANLRMTRDPKRRSEDVIRRALENAPRSARQYLMYLPGGSLEGHPLTQHEYEESYDGFKRKPIFVVEQRSRSKRANRHTYAYRVYLNGKLATGKDREGKKSMTKLFARILAFALKRDGCAGTVIDLARNCWGCDGEAKAEKLEKLLDELRATNRSLGDFYAQSKFVGTALSRTGEVLRSYGVDVGITSDGEGGFEMIPRVDYVLVSIA